MAILDEDGYHDLPPGKIASVVTYLEMRAPPATRPVPPRADLALEHAKEVDLDRYLTLYRRIGAEWLWFSRLMMSREQLAGTLHDPAHEVRLLRQGARDVGLMELDCRRQGEVELAYFGVAPELVGSGAGRWLMAEAIRLAWRPGVTRFWVHTCNLDHPAAPAFYIRSGFTPYKYGIEIGPDPRLAGALPRDAAPQVPVIG